MHTNPGYAKSTLFLLTLSAWGPVDHQWYTSGNTLEVYLQHVQKLDVNIALLMERRGICVCFAEGGKLLTGTH